MFLIKKLKQNQVLKFVRLLVLVLVFIAVPVTSVFADGEAGNALSFDGIDDYVILDETNTVMGGTSWKDTKTVSMWIKPEGIATACTVDVVSCDAVFGDKPRWWGMSRGILNGLDRIWVFNYDANIDYIGVQYTAGEWIHLSMVHSGGVMTVYKNGQLVGSVNSGTTASPDTGAIPTLHIGGMIVGSRNWLFEGDIDEVRLYNTALTQSEIQNSMFTELVGNEPGLAAYYTMNVLNGNSLPDDRVDALGDPVTDPHNGTLFGSGTAAPPYITASTAFDKPVTMDQSVTTNEDTAVVINLFGSDPQDDILTYSIVTPPANGVLSGTGPSRTYTPNLNYFGTDFFTYTVSDVTHTSAIGVISLTVNSVNDIPVADEITAITQVNTPVEITLTATDVEDTSFSFSVISQPAHGMLDVNFPVVTYTPAINYDGPDSFNYRVRDSQNASDDGTVLITVEIPNDPPVADDIPITTDEDIPVSFMLTATDTEGDPITYAYDTLPTKGTLSGTLPNVTYTPDPDENGSDTFTYYASDTFHDGPIATVSITINAVNDAPLANSQNVETDEDTPLLVTLSGSDVDGDSFDFVNVGTPAHGDLTGTAPNLTYTPDADYYGEDSFTFQTNDGVLNSADGTISITVNPINDRPLADDQTVVINEDTPSLITLTGSDVDNPSLTFAVLSTPTHGSFSGTAPNLTYTPDANYHGTDQFTFRTSDGTLNSITATVDITINPVNDRPTVDDQTLPLDEDTSVNFTLTGADIDGDPFTFNVIQFTGQGTINGSIPNFTYTPPANFNGTETFSFYTSDDTLDSIIATITFEVAPVNDAPVANNQNVITTEDTSVLITLSATDVDLDPLTYTVLTQPAHAVLTGSGNSWTYTPALNYQGADQFTFRAADAEFNSNTATVSINVTAVNDPPTADDQNLTTDEDTSLPITLTGSDPEGSTLAFNYTQPANGTVIGTAPNVIYTPDVNFFGSDSFTFTVSDGVNSSVEATISITVDPINDAPVADDQTLDTDEDTPLTINLTGSDVDNAVINFVQLSDPLHGELTGTVPNLTYTPNENYFGSDSFTFRTNDGVENSAVATIFITVNAVNDQPVADGQNLDTDEDTPLVIVLTGTDVEGTPLNFVYTQPAHGTVSGTGSNVTYTPDDNYFGSDSFTFTVNDGFLSSDAATVTIMVNSLPDVPVAAPDNYQVYEGEELAVAAPGVLFNDVDGDGDPLTAELVTGVSDGTLVFNVDGSFTYTPNDGFTGEDHFTYFASDGVLNSDTVMVTITVLPGIPVTSNFQVFIPFIIR